MTVTTAPLVLSRSERVALLGGELVANRLRARPRLRLILPTGHTPLGMYAALRAHAADGSLPAGDAELFQLDEYRGLGPGDPRSYRAYLRRELGEIGFGAVHGLDGSAADAAAECARHQALLDAAPLDLVVLGLGRDGHVAFDEPGAPADAGTRLVALHETTRADAAADFGGIDAVPDGGVHRRVANAPGSAGAADARHRRGEGAGVAGDARGRAQQRLPGVPAARSSGPDRRLRPARGEPAAAASRAVQRSRGGRAGPPRAQEQARTACPTNRGRGCCAPSACARATPCAPWSSRATRTRLTACRRPSR